jgi:hypothetical protein
MFKVQWHGLLLMVKMIENISSTSIILKLMNGQYRRVHPANRYLLFNYISFYQKSWVLMVSNTTFNSLFGRNINM